MTLVRSILGAVQLLLLILLLLEAIDFPYEHLELAQTTPVVCGLMIVVLLVVQSRPRFVLELYTSVFE